MIEIHFKKNEDEISLCSKGHAGFAEYGQDIVCAGVSALFLAAVDTLEKMLSGADERRLIVDIERGRGVIRLKAAAGFSQKEETVFLTVVNGVELIAKKYPDYVRINRDGI